MCLCVCGGRGGLVNVVFWVGGGGKNNFIEFLDVLDS